MSIYKNLKAAEEMGLEKSWAITKRNQYLTSELMSLGDYEENLFDLIENHGVGNEVSRCFSTMILEKHFRQKNDIKKELQTIKRMHTIPKDMLTDEMIETARRFPIERLIEFTRGKAIAWCHDDNRPSLTHLKRIDKAWCPVCDKKFDSIDVMMQVHGLDFKQAIKNLCGM